MADHTHALNGHADRVRHDHGHHDHGHHDHGHHDHGHGHARVPFAPAEPFGSLRLVRTPASSRWVARVLLVLFVASPVALAVVPWQQTVQGRGQVVAFAPTERRQLVTARVGGLIQKWHVVEGDRVKAGDAVVDIEDNDPKLAERLDEQKRFLSSRKAAALEELDEQRQTVAAQEKAMAAAVGAAKANREAAQKMVDVATETRKGNDFAVNFERRRYDMFEKLFRGTLPPDVRPSTGVGGRTPDGAALSGLVAELERDEAKVRSDRAQAELHRAEAEVKRAEATVQTNEAMVLQASAAGLSAVATARRDMRRAEQNVFEVERALQDIETRIEQFKARFVKSPVDGVVHRIAANAGAGGQFVKAGDELFEVLPDTTDRVVELLIDGVDAPLLSAFKEQTGAYPHVRLQFEGWPGVQFAGWPSVAIGTFGGRVRQMDPTDDGYGKFRVLVEPDSMFDGDTWPEGLYLRQGNQAVGWVFLNRVTLGYELWRQFNGFPPVIAPAAPDKGKGKDEKKDKSKPPKIKPAG